MQTDARKRSAAAQLELVRALVSNETAPDGFDSSRIQATAEALLRKRSHAVARAWPELARSLGSSFDERFAMYARSRPITDDGGPLADGRAFARVLGRENLLSEEVVVEALAFDLRYQAHSDRLIARRGIWLGAARLDKMSRFVIAIRVPVLGERWISIPLKIHLNPRGPRACNNVLEHDARRDW